ncbi:nucleotide exchange factor GrpE [Sphingomonas cannabina]|uniref:nucleotide exchange factor GrpE n=1 Tax=Sphingomonas cannabina TaxID=2899123 RepID=UPI001F21529B|nr:nucleotide exchange factor GrpE [Sphingomonas cannabina]UIJ45093.1 nucleotide exchange factor GrpE [Sphingomonas cannabina]
MNDETKNQSPPNGEELTAETVDLREETAEAAPEVADHDQVAKLAEELAEAKAAVLYARADAQNSLRRAEKELQDARAYAVTAFARDLLSVADNLARGLAAIPAELREDEKLKGLVTGIEATGRELDNVFARHGIAKITAMGEKLDPNRHQAMLEIPSADAEPGTIVQEMQAGYMLKDRLLRPALVGVAKAAD